MYFPVDPSWGFGFPLFLLSHHEKPWHFLLEKCVSYPLNFLGFLFPSCTYSTRCSQPLEAELTEYTQTPEYLLSVSTTFFTALPSLTIQPQQQGLGHFHCVYDKTEQLMAFWTDIRKRLDLNHIGSLWYCVCVCKSGRRGRGYNTMKVSNSPWMKTALPTLSTWIYACPGIICHG